MNLIRLILKIIFLKIKIKFILPKHTDIVVFDYLSINQLHSVIDGYKYFVLPGRFENITEIYLNYQLLKKIISNRKKGFSLSYNLSIIEILKPNLFITNIDNSRMFHKISKEIKKKFHHLQYNCRIGLIL